MAELIKMPRLSDTMEEGTLATWFKKVGDEVKEGDILAEIETDKATMEFESFYEGTLLYIGIQENETAKVDAPLAVIGSPGEDIKSLIGDNLSDIEDDKKLSNEKDERQSQNVKEKIQENSQNDDVHVVSMPRLSDTMEEGTVANWFKKVGDNIDEGEILAEIETDKATMEFESFYSGTLLHIGLSEGDSAKVDSLLAIIGPYGADITPYLNKSNIPDKKVEATINNEKSNLIEEKVVSKTDVISDKNKSDRIFISPLAKKLAKDRNIDIKLISGSGENGRIVKFDIENYKETTKQETVISSASTTSNDNFTEVNHSQMRKIIAKRLSESKFSAPHYYLNIELDMSETIAFRKQCNAIPETKISFNDIIIKACAVALKINPSVNSQWFEDKIRYNNFVNIGVAVGVDDGLIVPVLKNADKMSVAEISKSVKDLATKAREKKLSSDLMEGSTFTISNLGMFGIESFTSIVNPPNSVILSVGAIVEKPVVKDGQIVVGNTMKLTLACDHRVVDGLTGAKFLQILKPLIENPLSMLI
ncbi:2-oxo acid dehydrogenase subunit E2 [bacterium]|nr:2-oxo acid dehydrogenase subunit E2 [bacterium]